MSLADDIADATIRHQIYLQRYKSGVVKDILKLLGNVEDDIVSDLAKRDLQKLSPKQLGGLLNNLKRKIKNGYKPLIDKLSEEVKELGSYEKQFQMNMYERLIPINLSLISPSNEQIYAAAVARPFQGLLLREWYNGMPDGTFRRVKTAIRQGYVEGQTTQQIVRQIRGTRSQAGIIQQSRRGAEATVRTALAHTANVARNEIYKQNNSRIKVIQWVATLDGRTSAICRAYDGKVFPPKSGPRPPIHINCRSTTVAVFKTSRQLQKMLKIKNIPMGTRSSMNGQVAIDLDYNKWLKKQPKAFQNEVLGRKKGDLFRAGVPMDKFIDKAGNELTLQELKERESSSWAKAGL